MRRPVARSPSGKVHKGSGRAPLEYSYQAMVRGQLVTVKHYGRPVDYREPVSCSPEEAMEEREKS